MRFVSPVLSTLGALALGVACTAEPSAIPLTDTGHTVDQDGGGQSGVDGGGAVGDDGGVVGTGPFCDLISQVFVPQCTVCHKPGGNPPDLTFEGSRRELVNVASPMFPGTTRVVPNNREASLLWRKVANTQTAVEGTPMPTGSMGLPANLLAIVGAWIDAGAPTTCDQVIDVDGGVGRYHPANYAQAEVHGIDLKLQAQDCRTCHGNDLTGGSGASCDSCHQQGWRTNCTYCHGGTDSMTGAPPRELRGTTARDMLIFRPHTEHGAERNHIAWDCNQCHTKPTDVLSMDHVFDGTAGSAEVDFSGGLSPAGTYAAGRCTNLYCHGNGRTAAGMIAQDAARPACDGCHPSLSSTTRWLTMSGEHRAHLRERITCGECHAATVDAAGTAVTNLANHVNGVKDVMITAANFTYNAGTCNGTCHTERHVNRRW